MDGSFKNAGDEHSRAFWTPSKYQQTGHYWDKFTQNIKIFLRLSNPLLVRLSESYLGSRGGGGARSAGGDCIIVGTPTRSLAY